MTDSDALSPNASFCRICDALLTGKGKDTAADTTLLDGIADNLAQNEGLRVQMGTDSPSIWPGLHRAWDKLAEQVMLDEENASTRSLVTSFARCTRNLVAAVPSNQQNALAPSTSEPSVRRILYVYSSWSAIQDSQSYVVTRILIQALSNMVTSNNALVTCLWETYLNLPEEQAVFVRLLGTPDNRTILSFLILIINCIYEDGHRRELLVETPVGVRICISLLDRMMALYDAEDSSDGGKVFDYGYHLFAHLFDGGLAPKLYANLKIEDEIVAPHQTTLLKLLDSHLHSSHSLASIMGMCPMLTTCFFELCTFSVRAVRKAIGTGSADDMTGIDGGLSRQSQFDLFLPNACEALVLVTQCLVSVMLELEENPTGQRSANDSLLHIRRVVSPHGQNIAVCAIELLRDLSAFLPRINFGKPILSPIPTAAVIDPTSFSYVKRDLVRLLGILCHKDRGTQDSIRKCGGITVIMNMCVVDERNPYLREHAILTLHNLLEDNAENQRVVNGIQPSERWDENGMLQRQLC